MSLEKIREEIDRIDGQLIALLEERFDLVAKLLPFKQYLTDFPREKEILAKTNSPYLHSLYREIFRLSKELLKERGFPTDRDE